MWAMILRRRRQTIDLLMILAENLTNTKEPEGINSLVLYVNERNTCIDSMLSHLYGPGFEEPLDYDVATKDEMARVDSDIESSDDND
ncbi:hypothetical protein HAX54_018140 [Datura stramonium]|uniref:Uncharacterized protein n=1 Tax=Datura stramonium TaxID=4076 RepID=A0ABS8S176_DATST|nr:hypothetical protein [Datura stramonium]